MPVTAGRLTGRQSLEFSTYKVRAIVKERLMAAAGTGNGKSAKVAGINNEFTARCVCNAGVSKTGEFTLQLPDKSKLCDTVVFEVASPDGRIIGRSEYLVDKLPQKIEIKVEANETLKLGTNDNVSSGRVGRLTGRVLDTAGENTYGKVQVVLMGKIKGTGADFQPVFAARTDINGYFSGDFPRGAYKEAYATIGVYGGVKQPVVLEGDSFPQNLIFVVDARNAEKSAKSSNGTNGDRSGIRGQEAVYQNGSNNDRAVPRTPDQIDLVSASETYSSDLGADRSFDVTAPNRSIEEFTVYSVVRTTQPEIKGITPNSAKKLPVAVIEELTKLIESNNLRDLLSSLEESYQNGRIGESVNSFEARIDGLQPKQKAILKSIEQLKIDPKVLKALIQDPDTFSATQLLQADQVSRFEQLKQLLEGLSGKAPERSEITVNNPIDWDASPTSCQATTISHGHILQLQQTWSADGYSLGDLLYSVSIAPGQEKKVAIIDWDRNTKSNSGDTVGNSGRGGRLGLNGGFDRDINEVVTSAVREGSRGATPFSTLGRNAQAFAGGEGHAENSSAVDSTFIDPGTLFGGIGMSGGIGNGNSAAWQKASQATAEQTLQQLRSSTLQAASTIRNQRSTLVTTLTPGEAIDVPTETVLNPNRNHTITTEYFEILRHLAVNQDLVDVQECLFIPLLMTRFDANKALRMREPLKLALRDRRLNGAFDAIERRNNGYDASDLPIGSFADQPIRSINGELRIEFNISRPRDLEDASGDENLRRFDSTAWSSFAPFITWSNPEAVFNTYLAGHSAVMRDQIFEQQIAPRIAQSFLRNLQVVLEGKGGSAHKVDLDTTLVSEFETGAPLYVSLRPADVGADLPARTSVKSIRIITKNPLPGGSTATICDASMRYRTSHFTHWLFRDIQLNRELTSADPVSIECELDAAELRDPRLQDRELEKRLLTHLNEHLEYYHRAIWWQMDTDKRYMMLDGFQAPNAQGRSVASVVENRLIGIVGNCLVMPVTRGFHLDPTYKHDSSRAIDLLAHYAPITKVAPVRISLPARGVFAETVVGNSTFSELGEPVARAGSHTSIANSERNREAVLARYEGIDRSGFASARGQFQGSTSVTVPGTSVVTVPGVNGYTVPGTTGISVPSNSGIGQAGTSVVTVPSSGFSISPSGGISSIQGISGVTVASEGSPAGLLIRKAHNTLDQAEWKAFKEAITKLKRARGANGYRAFVDAYASTFKAHTPPWGVRTMSPDNGINFLAWHRDFLAQFEVQLGMPIPYWNWETSPEVPAEMSRATDLSNWGVKRKVGTQGNVPSGLVRSVLNDEVARGNWTVFQQRVEFELNNPLCLWVGGPIASPVEAVEDPLFWMHFAFIDKVWAEFQIRTGRAVNPQNTNERLQPGPIVNRSIGEVLNTFNLGYTYEALPFVGAQTMLTNVGVAPNVLN